MVVGLTGGIGSGKTTVVKLFQEFENVITYIADDRAKYLMNHSEEIKQSLIQVFGEKSFTNGILNRNYLSDIVFKDKSKLDVINSIVHPAVKNDFQQYVQKNKDKIVIYEAAILFESGSYQNCDFVISISVRLEERINRVLKRDNTSKEAVLQRVKHQWTETKRNLLSNYIIWNNSLESTKHQVKNIYNILTFKC